MSENQEKNNVIESYDGDPDDLVFFQTPVDEEYELEDEDIYEDVDEEIIEIYKEPSSEPEVVYENEAIEVTPVLKQESSEGYEQFQGMTTEIDLNDPHYANYQLDPYYDFCLLYTSDPADD